MAKQEFLDNFRIARNLFVHNRFDRDSQQVDPQTAANMLARAALWLTPKSVKGFAEEDFPELGADQQAVLRAGVREFSQVVSQVPPERPPTSEQLNKATAAFTKVLAILQPYLATPDEGEKVEQALKGIDLPSWIVNWDYELGSDEDGDPAVWINLYADENSAPRKEFGRVASQLTSKIRRALASVGINRWPFVRMRTAIEHKAL